MIQPKQTNKEVAILFDLNDITPISTYMKEYYFCSGTRQLIAFGEIRQSLYHKIS